MLAIACDITLIYSKDTPPLASRPHQINYAANANWHPMEILMLDQAETVTLNTTVTTIRNFGQTQHDSTPEDPGQNALLCYREPSLFGSGEWPSGSSSLCRRNVFSSGLYCVTIYEGASAMLEKPDVVSKFCSSSISIRGGAAANTRRALCGRKGGGGGGRQDKI